MAQAVECDPSDASRFDQAIKRLRQAVRGPRYPIVTEHKLASTNPALLRSMFL